MARPTIAAGGVGQVQVTQLANGKWRACARMRNDSGELVQLRAEGATKDAAREAPDYTGCTVQSHPANNGHPAATVNRNIEFGILIRDTALAASVEATMRSKHGSLYELVP